MPPGRPVTELHDLRPREAAWYLVDNYWWSVIVTESSTFSVPPHDPFVVLSRVPVIAGQHIDLKLDPGVGILCGDPSRLRAA